MLADLGEQPRVLDRDHRLCGKVLEQRDLPFAEWSDLLTINGKRAEQGIVPAQRHDQNGPDAAELDGSAHHGVITCLLGNLGEVECVKMLTGQEPAQAVLWGGPYRLPHDFRIGGRNAAERRRSEHLAVIGQQQAEARFAQASGLFEHGVEYRPEFPRRAVDDPQHLGDRPLLV